MSEPRIFAADRTFLRLRDAGILSETRSTDGLVLEVICGNWYVKVRGSISVEGDRREWSTIEMDWAHVQAEPSNPVVDAIDRVETHLRGLAARARKAKSKAAAEERKTASGA